MISCNLAASFARHGKRVLIMDCDMRRPMLHRHFKLTNELGLIAWFESGAKIPADPFTDPTLGLAKVEDNLFLLRFGRPLQESDRAAGDTRLRPADRVDEAAFRPDPHRLAPDGRRDRCPAHFRAHRRDHLRMPLQPRLPETHSPLHQTAREGKNELLGIVLNGLSPRRIEYYSNYRYYRSYKKYYGSQS